jgi:ABC-type branched-subunit amino acid transport system ATPase component
LREPPCNEDHTAMTTAAAATVTAAVAANAHLSINNIEVIYDHVILVLKGVSLHVPEGKIVTLLGANGAGKTTTLKAVSNLLRAERGDVTKGTIEFRGKRVDRLTPNDLVRMGVCQVMEGRHCFQHDGQFHGLRYTPVSRVHIRLGRWANIHRNLGCRSWASNGGSHLRRTGSLLGSCHSQ